MRLRMTSPATATNYQKSNHYSTRIISQDQSNGFMPVQYDDVTPPEPIVEEQMEYCDLDTIDDEEVERVRSLVIFEVMKDINLACKLLNIPADPTHWTIDNVEKWLLWTLHEYKLNSASLNMEYFRMNGINLCMMSASDFHNRAPHCGDIIHAQRDIWMTASKMQVSKDQPALSHNEGRPQYMERVLSDGNLCTSGNDSGSDDESASPAGGFDTSMTPNHTASIHLWQFLKELLLQPERFGHCIRYLDKQQGIFRIEDSVEVAKLWGLRKNRPNMNYDKLSRSIRQYYKKGIMKKTEKSQRLVYQFVNP
ncbi:SAM pointed domain-containing Ets transcription factor-like [Ptychodera flava]|uniref:SAM pointed domain-containing Ets transcription factor-like n=1 Tax=Ptychodera flava TaxID=63121 RepID=UPI00396A5C19